MNLSSRTAMLITQEVEASYASDPLPYFSKKRACGEYHRRYSMGILVN
jgi:hypothetical protein